jgi:dihydrodipicolinate synthase/N-acetylneuraminate lyase
MTLTPRGVVCPLATPLKDDETLDQVALERLLDHILPDIDGVLALGSSAEYALLRPEVAERVVQVTIEHVAGRVPVYVGVGDTGTARALDNLRRFTRPGVACVVATSSFYYPVADQAALQKHFLTLAEAATVPLVLYNIPQNTASNLAPESVTKLAAHPNVIAMKDSGGDMFQFQEFLSAVPPEFAVLQGREQLAAASLWLGSAGLVSALANLAPKLVQALHVAVVDGDRDRARATQREVTRVAQLFDQGYWLSALKVALAQQGFGSGRIARPLPELDREQAGRVRELLSGTVAHD